MKVSLLSFLLVICSVSQVLAQAEIKPASISGSLIDEDLDEPLGFANVAVFVGQDSLVMGATTDIDGKFSLTDLPPNTYRVEMSFIGYQTIDTTITLTAAEPSVSLENIQISTRGVGLEEVVITGERALMELGLDRKVFNVESSPE